MRFVSFRYALLCLTPFHDGQHTVPSVRLRLYQSGIALAALATVFDARMRSDRSESDPLSTLHNELPSQTLHVNSNG